MRQVLDLLDKHTMWCSLGGSCVLQASLKYCGYWSPPSPWCCSHTDTPDFFSTVAIRELEEKFSSITPNTVVHTPYNGYPDVGQFLNYPEQYDIHYFGGGSKDKTSMSLEDYYQRFWDQRVSPWLQKLENPEITCINLCFNCTNELYLHEVPARNELNQLLLDHQLLFLDYLHEHYPRRYKLLFLVEEHDDNMILPTTKRKDTLVLFCPKQTVFWFDEGDPTGDNSLNYYHYLASRYTYYEQLRTL